MRLNNIGDHSKGEVRASRHSKKHEKSDYVKSPWGTETSKEEQTRSQYCKGGHTLSVFCDLEVLLFCPFMDYY